MSRLVSKESVTGVIRAPFTEFEKATGGAEVNERPVGQGLRRAIGEVLAARDRAPAPGGDGGTLTAAVEGSPSPTCGQPRNATIALASTNKRAAPASREPDVPKPARYARVVRTWGR